MSETDQDSAAPAMLVTPEGQGVVEGPPPAGLSRRHMLMGVSLLAVSGLAYARMPKRRYADLTDKQYEALFPKAFGGWSTLPVSELIMPPQDKATDKIYQHILTRTYVHEDGSSVMFLAAYNSEQVNNVQLHRPEVCYAVVGFKIEGSRPLDIQLGGNHVVPARAVKAERNSRTENIVYWTRIGDEFPQSWAGQRISMTKANLNGFFADGILIRCSTIENDQEKSIVQLSRFIREMAEHCGPQARQIAFRA